MGAPIKLLRILICLALFVPAGFVSVPGCIHIHMRGCMWMVDIRFKRLCKSVISKLCHEILEIA